MWSWRMKKTSVFAIVSYFAVHAAADTAPLAVEWSNKSYGPDGPWNAVRIYAGTPRQQLDVHVGMQSPSYLLSSSFCRSLSDAAAQPCSAQDGGLYDPMSSTTSNMDSTENAKIDWQSPLNQKGSARIMSDMIAFAEDGKMQAPNSSIGLVDAASTVLSKALNFPVSLGVLSLGAPAFSQLYQASDGQVEYNVPATYLFQQNMIPSGSFGLHIGSASIGPPGSLYLGGFDRARAYGPIISRPYNLQGPPLTIDLVVLRIKVGPGASPFPYNNNRTIISLEANPPIGDHLNVQLSFDTPYLNLPRSTCDSIAQDLPVSFNETYGLYMWNVSDPRYPRIVTSASWLSFHFPGVGGNVDIRVPWMLLNLTLDEPITNTPMQYFPCHPVTTNYTLGRAFLQAAFVGVNWTPRNPPGTWFLAQAPGPRISDNPNVSPILPKDTIISGTIGRWMDTWIGVWSTEAATPPSETAAPGEAADSQTGLSSGARAGIAVGVVVGVIAATSAIATWVRYRRKQKAKDTTRTNSASTKDSAAGSRHEMIVHEHFGILSAQDKRAAYSSSSSHIHEIQSSQVHEVPYDPVHEVYGDVPHPVSHP